MKEMHKNIRIGVLCKYFNISRQAYYQHEWHVTEEVFAHGLILEEVRMIRQRHNRIGVRKLQVMLEAFMFENSIKLGRDGLFDLLSAHGLLIRRRKRHTVRTTQSFHWLKKYPNLILDFIPEQPCQLWVSDITYWKIYDTSYYVSLITDAYSRKIVGYHLSSTLHAEETVKALKMALSCLRSGTVGFDGLIHHSDRGVQYCSSSYVSLLNSSNIRISMTQSGDPLENATAERVNGIIKDEYLLNYKCDNIGDAINYLSIAVSLYNKERPHGSIGYFTPEYVHNQYNQIPKENIKKLWKNYYTKRTD